ncbi:hypothetical protein BC937DRAFT_95123 [Endogone sp. FLAS-F59071]|nr:hypothetical protein BC937DRAFT_95123 [Endogone sp. FLAS-F59071]|eukprot:RUS22910.1 hypothetical protein BC937DRAFT_95123 [Endogone sp. FLAS-F59071]
MSEYWVSQSKHWCQYCKKYIADNKATRQLHESGKTHKEAVEKFLRDVYKRNAADKKEQESVRREVERIEKAALKQYTADLGGQVPPDVKVLSSKTPGSSSKTITKPTPKLASPAPEPKSLPPPPREVAMPGEWTIVTPPAAKVQGKDEEDSAATEQNEEEEEEDPDDLRNFKVVEKTLDSFEIGGGTKRDRGEMVGDEETTGALFKKRKVGGQGKVRNIRKKT